MNDYEAVPESDSSALSTSEPLTNDRNASVRELINQHNDELVNYIRRWVRTKADAQDVAQEAYARIFRLGDPSVVSHFRAYLFQAAKNIACNLIRSRLNLEKFVKKESLKGGADTITPERICIAREELEAVKRAFQLLPPRTRLVIHLRKEDGLSYEEIGLKLGIKALSVRRLVDRAMEFLLEAVSQESNGETLPEQVRESGTADARGRHERA
jgi:RNA polymerase sigma factor (sigma-70 family)